MLFNNTNMRTAMAYTNAVGDKVYPIIVDIKKGIKSTEEISFVSSDINTGILSVAFIQGNDTYNVEGAEVICSIMRPDTTTLEIPCNIINGNTIEVPLGVNGTSQDGVYSFDFKVFKGGNKIVGTPIMNYSVSLSISNDLVVEEDDRLPVLTMLMTQVSELHDRTDEAVVKANTATVASREATANAIVATNNANAVSERVSQETATAISEIRQDTANAIASMNQSTSTAISNMNQSTNDAIDSMNQSTNDAIASMTQKTDEALANMNQSTTDAISSMTQKTDEAVTMVNNNLANINNVVTTKVTELDNAKSDMTNTVTNKIDEVETRFNALTSKQQQDAEVIDARDGETSLKARLDRDIEKAKQVYVNVEGSHISTDSSSGYAKDIEILGNTVQDASNLADIRSVGDKVEGQELYEIPVLSVGKNLFDKDRVIKGLYPSETTGELLPTSLYGCSDYIKIKPNTTYKTNSSNLRYAIYNKDKLFICGGIAHRFATPNNAKFVRVCVKNEEFDTYQLEEGTVATPYEPYQEDKLTILSPVQLEKVGDVRDRIIEKDGVWGVEKNVASFTLNGTENWQNGNYDTVNHVSYRTVMPKPLKYTNQYATLFTSSFNGEKLAWFYIYNDKKDVQGYGYGDNGYFYFRVPNTKTIEDFKQDLSKKPIIVLGCANEPQFIPLPHDQQVKLRTFANKTNISFGCEIEGTIKAQVPKSLGATVNTHTEQISNLNKELDRVKKLEESTVSTVTTESDFTTVEATSGGYFEDVKLEGKTLVNLLKTNAIISYTAGVNEWKVISDTFYPLSVNKKYTLICNITKNTLEQSANTCCDFYMSNGSANAWGLLPIKSKYTGLAFSSFSSSIEGLYKLQIGFDRASTSGEIEITDFVILEGDHTQNPPSYFEGLKSVSDGADEIVVSSVKGDGNLFDGELFSGWVSSNGIVNQVKLGSSDNIITNYIKVKPNQDYANNFSFDYVWIFDRNRNFIKLIYKNSPINVENGEYAIFGRSIAKQDMPNIDMSKIQIVKGTKISEYTPYQSNKKPLLYYNPTTSTWEKPILRQWDSIEKHADGKYYYHQRSGEVVLNGSENWTISTTLEKTNTIFAYTNLPRNIENKYLLCDRFAYEKALDGYDIEGVRINAGVQIRLSKSKLSTQDVQGFKQWLQANNVTVVYQLAQEKVYECTNLDLITYANETNYIVECGAIAPKSILKVHNNISNVVKILQQKVSLLENKFIEGLKQVLAGDMYSLAELLYPEDFEEVETENSIMLLPLE